MPGAPDVREEFDGTNRTPLGTVTLPPQPGIKPQAPGHRLPARHAKGVPYHSERTSGATG